MIKLTLLLCAGAIQDWVIIVREDFTYGFGVFYQHGNDATYYTSAINRAGVVHIEDGEGGSSMMELTLMSLEHNPFSRIKASLSSYAVGMEILDGRGSGRAQAHFSKMLYAQC